MSVKAYKITCIILACLLVWFAWKYISLYGQIMTARMIGNQARHLRNDIENAGAVYSRNGGVLSDRDLVLTDLKWYLDYYDHRTNWLAGSPVLFLVSSERNYITYDVIAYLRRSGTNDYGDDPYEWVRHEFAH